MVYVMNVVKTERNKNLNFIYLPGSTKGLGGGKGGWEGRVVVKGDREGEGPGGGEFEGGE